MKLLAENIQLLPGDSFRLLRWRRSLREVEVVDAAGRAHPLAGAGDRWHYHAHTELTAIVRGSGLRFIGDDIRSFRAPDVVLIGGGLPHYWHEAGTTAGFAVQMGPEFEDTLARFGELAALGETWRAAARGVQFSGRGVPAMLRALRALERARGPDRIARLLAVLAAIARWPRRDCRPIARAPVPTSRRAPPYRGIQTAVHIAFERFAEPLQLDTLLPELGMSRATFCRQFRRFTGRTFSHFVAEVRLNHAARRLAETEEPVGAIAFASGWNNLSHFHHQFRAMYRCTPLEFRRKFQAADTPRRIASPLPPSGVRPNGQPATIRSR
ncbi:MAG: AraC family transcriptional regulator [Kiritimatiellae bacterium]|nr:AraC family transcriptional regulator [Kiritimatiellia bacterium]